MNTKTICRHCDSLCSIIDHTCYPNWDPITEQLISCYSCGKGVADGLFSNSQLQKEYLARCRDCVRDGITSKYVKPCKEVGLDKQLYNAVSSLDVQKVTECLKHGANPNYRCQKSIWVEGRTYLLYDNSGNEIASDENDAPITPMRSCLFSVSNVLNTEQDQANIRQIAQLLIEHGADLEDAAKFNSRYGDTSTWWIR